MKKMKKAASMFLALAVVFSLAVPAFAADGDVTVSVTLQTADVPEGVYSPALDQLTNVQTIAAELSVSVPAGSTVKDAVNAVIGSANIVTCADCGDKGCVTGASGGCAHNAAACDCTWKRVELLDENWQPTGTYASALNGFSYGGQDYFSAGGSVDLGGGLHRYSGNAWEYYVDGAYQNLYMDQIPVSAAQEIVLSYNYSSFIW